MSTLFPNISLSLSLSLYLWLADLGFFVHSGPAPHQQAHVAVPLESHERVVDTLSVQPRHASVRAINFNAKDLASAQASAEDEEPTLRFDTGFECVRTRSRMRAQAHTHTSAHARPLTCLLTRTLARSSARPLDRTHARTLARTHKYAPPLSLRCVQGARTFARVVRGRCGENQPP